MLVRTTPLPFRQASVGETVAPATLRKGGRRLGFPLAGFQRPNAFHCSSAELGRRYSGSSDQTSSRWPARNRARPSRSRLAARGCCCSTATRATAHRQPALDLAQPRTTYPGLWPPICEPLGHGTDGQLGDGPPAVGAAHEGLHVDPVLLGVGEDVHRVARRLGLFRDRGEGIDGDQRTAGGIGEGLGGHDADAQAGVAAGATADDHPVDLPGTPVLLGQQGGHRRRQVAGIAPILLQQTPADQSFPLRHGHLALAARRFHDQQTRLDVFTHAPCPRP